MVLRNFCTGIVGQYINRQGVLRMVINFVGKAKLLLLKTGSTVFLNGVFLSETNEEFWHWGPIHTKVGDANAVVPD